MGQKRGRLSSIISTLRRGSTHSNGGQRSIASVNLEADAQRDLCKDSEGKDKRTKFKKLKQKSLFNLLRSTRQSNAQSVVHRNGDVIIMKGGKIVSVRRGGEGREASPFLERLQKLTETSDRDKNLEAGLAGPGKVMFELICDDIVEQSEEEKDNRNKEQEEEDTVFIEDKTGDVKNKEEYVVTSNVKPNGIHYYGPDCQPTSVSSDFKSETETNKRVDSPNRDVGDVSEQTKTVKESANGLSNKSAEPTISKTDDDAAQNQKSEKRLSQSLKGKTDLQPLRASGLKKMGHSFDSTPATAAGITINVQEDNDILSVMPLTPVTREHLAKSDMQLSQSDPKSASAQTGSQLKAALPACRSTENLGNKSPRVKRLPSLEFLDPPVALFRSRSNASMSSKTEVSRLRSKSPRR